MCAAARFPGPSFRRSPPGPLLRIVSAMLMRFDAAAPADTLLIHSRAQIGLADYCRLRGVPFDAVLRESGLETETVSASLGGHISLRAHSSALEAASRLADDDTFGLGWTRSLGPGPEDTVSLAVRHAPNFRTALEVSARFMRIVADVAEVRAEFDGETAELAFGFSPELVCRDQLHDRVTSKVFGRLMRIGGGSVQPLEVRLARPRPLSVTLHDMYYGVPVRFGAPRNSLHFRIDPQGGENPLRDDDLFDALCELNRRRLDDRRRAEDFVAMVNDAIAERIADPILTISEVARGMAISVRALQRKLAERDTTFNALHDGVRRRMAADYLVQTDLPISEIAFRLGFSAVGNFSRAARRWFGRPPSECRSGALKV